MKRDLLFDLIEALTILPGVGKKSAQRMALYLLDKNKDGAAYLGDTLKEALENVQRCKQCRILTSDEYCRICSDSSRDQSSLCIVESPSDVLAIESTGGFKGRYFVLMGRLSPIDGIAPEDLGIPDLLQYIKTDHIEEVNFFDMISFYVLQQIRNTQIFRSDPINGRESAHQYKITSLKSACRFYSQNI